MPKVYTLQPICRYLSYYVTYYFALQIFLGEKIAEGLLLFFERGSEIPVNNLQLLLSEMHFTLLDKCGKYVQRTKPYFNIPY